jgi:hypothetical protein
MATTSTGMKLAPMDPAKEAIRNQVFEQSFAIGQK